VDSYDELTANLEQKTTSSREFRIDYAYKTYYYTKVKLFDFEYLYAGYDDYYYGDPSYDDYYDFYYYGYSVYSDSYNYDEYSVYSDSYSYDDDYYYTGYVENSYS
jgi:hypothetical protein